METREKVFIALAFATIAGVLYLSLRPVQVDIAPAPSKPLSDDVVNEAEHAPSKDSTPSLSRYKGMFMYPLAFARAMPITSTRLQ